MRFGPATGSDREVNAVRPRLHTKSRTDLACGARNLQALALFAFGKLAGNPVRLGSATHWRTLGFQRLRQAPRLRLCPRRPIRNRFALTAEYGRDPNPRSREVFTFHRPETFQVWTRVPRSFRSGIASLLPLSPAGLRECPIKAITNLEASLKVGKPRALAQIETGSGKIFTAITQVYRLLKHADTQRVLFLVDTRNLGEQAETVVSFVPMPAVEAGTGKIARAVRRARCGVRDRLLVRLLQRVARPSDCATKQDHLTWIKSNDGRLLRSYGRIWCTGELSRAACLCWARTKYAASTDFQR